MLASIGLEMAWVGAAAARGTTVVENRMLPARTPARSSEEADVRIMVRAAEEESIVGSEKEEWRWVQSKQMAVGRWRRVSGLESWVRLAAVIGTKGSINWESLFS